MSRLRERQKAAYMEIKVAKRLVRQDKRNAMEQLTSEAEVAEQLRKIKGDFMVSINKRILVILKNMGPITDNQGKL